MLGARIVLAKDEIRNSELNVPTSFVITREVCIRSSELRTTKVRSVDSPWLSSHRGHYNCFLVGLHEDVFTPMAMAMSNIKGPLVVYEERWILMSI